MGRAKPNGGKFGSKRSRPPPKRGGRVPKVASIDFDESGRTDFITGFHKRKKQRQQVAIKQMEERERQDRLDRRARKRSQLLEARQQRQQLRDVLKSEQTNKGLLLARPFKDVSDSSAREAANYDIGDVHVQVTTSSLEDLEEEQLQRMEDMEMESSDEEEVTVEEGDDNDGEQEEELDPWDPFPLQWYEHSKEEDWRVRQNSYHAGTVQDDATATVTLPTTLSVYSLNLIGLEKWLKPRINALITYVTKAGLEQGDCQSAPFDFVCLYEVPKAGLEIFARSAVIRRIYALSDFDGSSFDKKTACGTLVLAKRDTWLPYCASPIFNRFSNTVMGRGCMTWKIRRTPTGKPITLAAAFLEGKCSLGPKTRKLQLKQVLSNLSMAEHAVGLVGDFSCYGKQEPAEVSSTIAGSQFTDLRVTAPCEPDEECDVETVDEALTLGMLARKARRKPRCGAPDKALLCLPPGVEAPVCEQARILSMPRSDACPEGIFASTHRPILAAFAWPSTGAAITGKRKQRGGSSAASKKRATK
mmetsp:Transcript_1619/g.5718  ORF Transcript_1619/g.5718 Transcript_1619/m.5718 type:complete len:530 (+) Transcript_1619:16-1605(+)